MIILGIIAGVLLLMTAVYLWLIFPAVKRRDLTALCARPIAHRGVHDSSEVAENSLGAFALAVNAGLPIELDVRLSSDNVPVVMHDSSIRRMCGVDKQVRELTAKEFCSYSFTESGEHLPTLAEVLSLVDGKVPLLIELKGDDRYPVSEETAKLLDGYKGGYAIESFNPYYLYRYRRIKREAAIGLLAERASVKDGLLNLAASRVLVNFAFRPDFIAYGYTKRLPISVKLAKAFGCKLMVWTIRDKERYEDSKKRFDGIIAEKISETAR